MAEVIHLSIEYSTERALAQIRALEAKLATLEGVQVKTRVGARRLSDASRVLDGAFRGAGLGAVRFAQALATGNISAVTMASSTGKLGQFLLGPWGVALSLAAAAVAVFVNHQRKAVEQAQKWQDQLRETKKRVDDLLAVSAVPFAAEIDRITEAIRQLDRTAAAMKGNLLERLFGVAPGETLGTAFGRFLFGGAPIGTTAHRQEMQGQQARLTPQAALDAAQGQRSADFARASRLLTARGQRGRGTELEETIRVLNDHMERLADLGNVASKTLQQTGQELIEAERALREFNRGIRRTEDLLFSVSDAFEDLVLTGTFAFRQFIDNIFRILYRDATGKLIENFVLSLGGQSSRAGAMEIGPAAGPAGPASTPFGPPHPQVMSNVTFNVNAIDAQGVAAFFDREGGRIAATVAKQAARSKSLRTAFAR